MESFATGSLTAISLVAGWLLGWGFLRLSHRAALGAAMNRLRAHLMELRLFADEPALVWNAQWDLLKANGAFLWHMLRPLALLALPAGLLLWQLEAYYSRAPLHEGETALITLESKQPLTEAPVLRSAGGISVETQAVRWNLNYRATWRVRAQRAGLAHLPLVWNGASTEVAVVAGDWFLRLPSSQSHNEARIRVDYPERTFRFAGLSMSWSTWFLLWSSLAAMVAVWWHR